MANLTVSFNIDTVNDQDPAPIYRVTLSAGIIGTTTDPKIDNNIFVIERKTVAAGEEVDVFYGIAKAVDFSAMRKVFPNAGQKFYRTSSWVLVFYNLATMNEAMKLIKSQVDGLADQLPILLKQQNNRFETHQSPSF